MTKKELKKAQQSLDRWREVHSDTNSLRRAYQQKIPDWVVKSMEFEGAPVSMPRLKELLAREKAMKVSQSPA
jgi:hypothetical protein